jgi:protein-disulfide isomerase
MIPLRRASAVLAIPRLAALVGSGIGLFSGRRVSARAMLLLLSVVAGFSSSAAHAARARRAPPPPPPSAAKTLTSQEFDLGNPKARVVLVEYASDTCPHCARFAAEVFPEFKKRYIDSGQVLYVFREFPTPPVPLASAGFVLARCAGAERYFDVVNALFQAQGPNVTGLEFLMAGAKAAGLNEAQVKACVSDSAAVEALNTRVKAAVENEKIEATPTFLLNGQKMPDGEKSLKQLADAIEPLLKAQTSSHPGL